MSSSPTTCPKCGSDEIAFIAKTREWLCTNSECSHRWSINESDQRHAKKETKDKGRLFLSYGRRDAINLANRLCADLSDAGYEVWRDINEIGPGNDWQQAIVDGLRSTQLVVAVLSPHAVRVATDPANPDKLDSVCLDEVSFARFAQPPKPILPVMALSCEPNRCWFDVDLRGELSSNSPDSCRTLGRS